MARVAYLSRQDATPDTEAVWARVETERKLPTANIFRALANAPTLLDSSLTYANALRNKTELDPKLRELAILTVGHATHSEYEIAHHQAHAATAGVTPEQLANIPSFETSSAFDARDRAVMRLARDSTLNVHVPDQLWADARAHLSDRQLVELTLNIGFYNSGVRIMAMLDIELEDAYLRDPVAAGATTPAGPIAGGAA
jgi:AhpD family alkylhydroperoxidase